MFALFNDGMTVVAIYKTLAADECVGRASCKHSLGENREFMYSNRRNVEGNNSKQRK